MDARCIWRVRTRPRLKSPRVFNLQAGRVNTSMVACLGDVVRDTGLRVVRGGAVRVGVDFRGALSRSASASTAGGAGGASSARSARAVMRDDTLAPSWRGSLAHAAFQTLSVAMVLRQNVHLYCMNTVCLKSWAEAAPEGLGALRLGQLRQLCCQPLQQRCHLRGLPPRGTRSGPQCGNACQTHWGAASQTAKQA